VKEEGGPRGGKKRHMGSLQDGVGAGGPGKIEGWKNILCMRANLRERRKNDGRGG